MGLPQIAPYAMPTERDLPGNRVSWRPDPGRAALLVHDMQNYFAEAFDRTNSPMPELVANISALRARCRRLGIPVIFTAQPGGQSPRDRGLLQDFWGPGIGSQPREAQIISALTPDVGETLLTKWRYSAFQRTSLREDLRRLGRDQLIVTGIYAHIGCLMSACEAFMQDIQPFFVADAVADFSAEHHASALTWAADRCAVTLTTGRLMTELAGSRPTAARTGG